MNQTIKGVNMGLFDTIFGGFKWGDGGHTYHPKGGRGRKVDDSAYMGRALNIGEEARIGMWKSASGGWDCEIDGHRTKPIEGSKRKTQCVECGDIFS